MSLYNSATAMYRKRVFDSVFAPASLYDIAPTPVATPPTAFIAPGQPFGLTLVSAATQSQQQAHLPTVGDDPGQGDDPWPEQVRLDRAWHVATTFLSVNDIGFEALAASEEFDEILLLEKWVQQSPSPETSDALNYLVGSLSGEGASHARSKDYDLAEWYGNEMRRHFLANFRDGLVQLVQHPEYDGVLSRLVGYLQLAQRIYYTPFLRFLVPLLNPTRKEITFINLRRDFHAIVAYSLPSSQTSTLLAAELATDAFYILGIHNATTKQKLRPRITKDNEFGKDDMNIDQNFTSYHNWRHQASGAARDQMIVEGDGIQAATARGRLLSLLEGVQDVGLGGSRGQKIFAGVMNAMMTEFIRASYSGEWESPSLVTHHLRLWIENVFARLVVEVLNIFNVSESEVTPRGHLDVLLSDVEKWQEIGITCLGALRTSELFDVIVEWDSSRGAIEDLKHYASNPNSRFNLTNSFIITLNQRLLQPGAATVEILQLYISIIRAFNFLDPKGVLLDRVARPIRRYLRDREDTIKVIVSGLLADATGTSGQSAFPISDTLTELSAELIKAHEQTYRNDSGELDWDDMNWVPDPIDAAPDYKKSKNSDVIGSLISLFESKETFVKELQTMLGERLLRKRADFSQELSVLELLKVRFGDGALQACEVMLRDIFDSKRVDTAIRSDQGLTRNRLSPQRVVSSHDDVVVSEQSNDIPQLHAKILSRFFWPTLQDRPFKVPNEIVLLQGRYSAGFESLKKSRKLTWLNGLGQVTVELDLSDRVFTDEVTTWQASVIYAFQSPSNKDSKQAAGPVSKTVTELSQQLEMSAFLVRSACLFWVSKRILTEPHHDTFEVLEVLPNENEWGFGDCEDANMDTAAGDPPNRASGASAVAKELADAAAMEKMNLYWQFIVGMLTNQGAMPLQRIVMMLRIAVPGGFPYSNEELREFLTSMVSRGKLEVVSGGSYKLAAG